MIRSLLIVALAASCLAVPAVAQTSDRATFVRDADLDLDRAQDIKRLDLRISRAAAAACGPVSTVDPGGMNATARCIRETIAATRPQRDAAVRRRVGIQQASAR